MKIVTTRNEEVVVCRIAQSPRACWIIWWQRTSTRKWPTTDLRHDKRLNCVWKIYCNSLCGLLARLYVECGPIYFEDSLRKSPVEILGLVICFEDILGQKLKQQIDREIFLCSNFFCWQASGDSAAAGIFSSLSNKFLAKTPKIFAYFLFMLCCKQLQRP